MEYKISEMIAANMSLTKEEAFAVDDLIPIITYKKGTVLLEAGQTARNCYFTLEGCVRSYRIIEGNDLTTSFYTEQDAIVPLKSYLNQIPANHYLACEEDCVLAVLNYYKEKELYRQFPKFENLCRSSIKKEFRRQQELITSFQTKTPEERYQRLLESKPELLQRISQYHLASYLGIKPESFIHIRKQMVERLV